MASRLGTGKPLTFFAVYSNDISPYVPFYKKLFSYFLWLECVGYSVVYVGYCGPFCIFVRLLDSNPESSLSKQARCHLLYLPELTTHLPNLVIHLPNLATFLPNFATYHPKIAAYLLN